ncbi:hypothetical protein [Halobacillus halophilus]|uniref:hypothetical protein n=1 Tax=Halobacillus halophilus TaxID=1570 RepID=UPI001CD4758D|nr:hypothetical protein [Halobacillus halophilus]MCA1012538.1 hypothetical protein [Halobacillus halophilus]
MKQAASYFQLSEEIQSDEERAHKVQAIMTEMMAFGTLQSEQLPKGEVVDIHTLEITRDYYRFHLALEIRRSFGTDILKETYRFTFTREDGRFKINGIEKLD